MERILPIERDSIQKRVVDIHWLLWDKTRDRINFENGFSVETHSHFLREGFHFDLEFSLFYEDENRVKQFVLSVGKSDYRIVIDYEERTMTRTDFNQSQYTLTVNNLVLFNITCADLYTFINNNCTDLEIIKRILK